MMYADAKESVESGGEEPPNSNSGIPEMVRECVFRVMVLENQPPPSYSFKPDIIIAMIASVTAYVPKDAVLLNDREAMVEFEGEVPIDILNEQLSMMRKWMGVSDVKVQCCHVASLESLRQGGYYRKGPRTWAVPTHPPKL